MINRANIILTHNCNLRCKHCYIDAKNCKEDYRLIFEESKKILKKLKENNIKNVMFTGGECMIFPYLKELIMYAKKLEFKITIFTNGMVFDKEIFDLVDYINLSLDGPESIHNFIRQNNKSYENVIKVLDYLKEKNINTTLQVTINKLNVNSLDFLGDLTLNNLNVRNVKLVFVSNVGRSKENNIFHDIDDIKNIYSRLDFLYEKSKYHIQFIPNVIKKYDFENYYLSGNLSFPLWIDMPNKKYYVLSENLLGNYDLNTLDLEQANKDSKKLIKTLYDTKNKIEENEYINIEDELANLFKGD